MPLRPLAFSSLAIALTFAGTAQAKTIYASGDWALDDSQPGVAGKGNCVAATATYLGNHGAYSLNLVLDKSGAHPLELMIRPFRSPSKAVSFQVEIESGKIYGFAKLPRTAKGEDTFWQVPLNTEAFLAELKRSKQLNVKATNEMGELPFSMSGATAVLTQLEKRCGARPALNSVRFEKMFLTANDLDLAALDATRTALLRDTVTKGAAAFRLLDNAEVELATLDSNRVKFEKEQTSLPGDIEQLKKRGIPALEAARGDIQSAIDRAHVDISSAQSSLAAQEKLLNSAQTVVEQAKSKRKPHVAEQERLAVQSQADQQALVDLESQSPEAREEIAAAEKAAQASADALTKFRASVGYEALDLAVQQAEAKALPVQAAVASLKSTLATREQWVKDQTKARDEADKKITAAKEDLAKKIAHLAEIPAWLQKFPSERKSLEAKIEQAKQGLSVVAVEFAGRVPQGKR